jgi:hypothetical protein
MSLPKGLVSKNRAAAGKTGDSTVKRKFGMPD